ncbi:MAG: DUF1579 domain-containing protein [Phycisphaerales bacterium]
MKKTMLLGVVVSIPLFGAALVPLADRSGRGSEAAQPEGDMEGMPGMPPPPGEHHAWLDQLVGEWRVESDMGQGPDAEPLVGVDTVRSIGGRWVVCEMRSDVPGMGPMHAVMTLGYNPETGTYQGTWVDSVHDHLWIYEGTLDDAGNVLTLEAEGPNMMDPAGGTAMYRDVIEFKSENHRTLTSFAQIEGEWVQFATAQYRRAE